MSKATAVGANVLNSHVGPVLAGFIATGLLAITVPLAASTLSVSYTPGVVHLTIGIVVAGPVRVSKSLEILREERRRTAEERDAFKQLASRINQLTPPSPQLDSAVTVSTAPAYDANSPGAGAALTEARDIYRDTVLDMDHYDEDYGDSEIESIGAEFGFDLANAVQNGDTLSAALQELLVSASTESATQRGEYLQVLDAEISALDDVRQDLEDASHCLDQRNREISELASFQELVAVREEIIQVQERCELILQQRQETKAELPQVNGFHLNEYLYSDRDWTYPVLADSLDILAESRSQEQRVTEKLSYSP